MRRVLFVGLVAMAGCGKKPDAGTGSNSDGASIAKPTERAKADEPRPVPKGEPATPVDLKKLAEEYQRDANAADAKYRGKRVQLLLYVNKVGEGWAGGYAFLKQPTVRMTTPDQVLREARESALRGNPTNVVFLFGKPADAPPKADSLWVLEGVCNGLGSDATVGPKLTFTDGRAVHRVTNPKEFVWPPKGD